jgi:putative hydroxymethylpyrimidine transport system substrate-binding protein
LTLKDVTLINVNFALTTALMSKQVDGVIGAFRNFELNDLALHKAKGACGPSRRRRADLRRADPRRQARDGRRRAHPEAARRHRRGDGLAAGQSRRGVGHLLEVGKELDNELNKLAWRDTLPLLAADPDRRSTAPATRSSRTSW